MIKNQSLVYYTLHIQIIQQYIKNCLLHNSTLHFQRFHILVPTFKFLFCSILLTNIYDFLNIQLFHPYYLAYQIVYFYFEYNFYLIFLLLYVVQKSESMKYID